MTGPFHPIGVDLSHDRAYIGGGNIAGILGVSPFSSPLQEYLKITGQALPPTAEEQRFFRTRKKVEPFVLSILEEEEHLAIINTNKRYTDGNVSIFKAEIDAEVWSAHPSGIANVEIKSVHPLAARGWGHEAHDTSVPVYVIAQAMWGLRITEREEALAVPQVGFDDTRLLPIRYDDEVASAMRGKARAFWDQHVMVGLPPLPTTLEDARLLWARSIAKTVEAGSDVKDAVRQLIEMKALIKANEATADGYKLTIINALGECDTLVDAKGHVLCTWKQPRDSQVTDWERLAMDLHRTFLATLSCVGEDAAIAYARMRRSSAEWIRDFTTIKANSRRLLTK